jgi:hypothetical protein
VSKSPRRTLTQGLPGDQSRARSLALVFPCRAVLSAGLVCLPGSLAAYVRRSELVLVMIGESMTRAAMHKRVEIEAERRGIERVAWIEEF